MQRLTSTGLVLSIWSGQRRNACMQAGQIGICDSACGCWHRPLFDEAVGMIVLPEICQVRFVLSEVQIALSGPFEWRSLWRLSKDSKATPM